MNHTTLCMIPARAGSQRVPAKNLRYLCGKPLISYAVDCAKACACFDDVYVNTDSPPLMELARQCGVKAYERAPHLASDDAQGDDFTADFMEKMQPETMVMISPVCPLVTPDDVHRALDAYAASDCDTLITCEQTQMQVFCQGRGVNVDDQAPLQASQKNPCVQILNWAVAIWDTATFLETYRAERRGYLGKNRLLFPIDPLHALKISHEEDFRRAERLIQLLHAEEPAVPEPHYWSPGAPSV